MLKNSWMYISARLCSAVAVVLLAAGIGRAQPYGSLASGEWDYRPLQSSDLVVRGTVVSASVEQVSSNDFWMDEPAGGAPKEVCFVTLAVREVLRGPTLAEPFRFMVYRDPRETQQVFRVGSEMLVCLYYHERLRTYYQTNYYSRYVRDGQAWRSGWTPLGDKIIPDVDLRAKIDETSIQNVAADAELVVEGTVEAVSTKRVYGPDSTSADLVTFRLQADTVIKGRAPENPLSIVVMTRGIYWPAWRRDAPRSYTVGQRWLCFLRRNDLGWYPFAGSNGLFRIEGETLIYADRVAFWRSREDVESAIRPKSEGEQ